MRIDHWLYAIPKPTPPSSDKIVEKGTDLGDWVAGRGSAFWLLVVVAIAATIITAALKRPFIKGIAIGAIILTIALIVF